MNYLVPTNITIEADNLAKETGLNFRDCLEILVKAYLDLASQPKRHLVESCFPGNLTVQVS